MQRRKVQNNRFLAGFLTALTAFTPVVSSLPVYAADSASDGITVDESSNGDSISVSGNSDIVLSSDYTNGESAIVIEDKVENPTRLRLKLASLHGELVISDATDSGLFEEQHVRLVETDDGKAVSVCDAKGNLISQTAYTDDTQAVLDVKLAADSIVCVEAVADTGYDVSEYAVIMDSGDAAISVEGQENLEATNFQADLYASFGYNVILDQDKTIRVDFESLADITIAEPSKSDNNIDVSKGSGIVVTKEDAKAAKDAEKAESKDNNIQVDEKSSDETDSDEDDTKYEASDVFLNAESSAKQYDIDAFASARLVVLSDDETVFLDPENIIGRYDNLYLLQYNTPEQARNAYVYYLDEVGAVEPDALMDAATGTVEESVQLKPMDETNNPVAAAAEAETAEADETMDRLIALVDSGVMDDTPVFDRVSVLDEKLYSSHTHGTDMAQAIYSVHPEASILSIRALDDSGDGTISSITAAIKYAIVHDASIINLSLCARKTLATSVLESVIREALDEQIMVVGSAGNYCRNASEYVPGFIQDAYVIGACDEYGDRIGISNYGMTVDYNVVADSTSEAAAKFSGYLSKNGVVIPEEVNQGMVYQPDYDSKAIVPEDPSDESVGSGSILNQNNLLAIVESNDEFDSLMKSVDDEGGIDIEEEKTFELRILESYSPYFSAQALEHSSASLSIGTKYYYGCGAGSKTKGQYWSSNTFTAGDGRAYCLNPSGGTPSSGTYSITEIANSTSMAKAFYRYDIQNNWMGIGGGYTSIANTNCLGALHILLAKLSGDARWNNGVHNDTTLMNVVGNMEANLRYAQTPPGRSSVSVTPGKLKAQVVGDIQKTGNYVVTGGDIRFTVENGVTLVNVSDNSRHTGFVRLPANTRFYFEAPVDHIVKRGGNKLWTITVDYDASGFEFFRIGTAAGVQDMIGYFRLSKAAPVSFSVEFVDVGFARMLKVRDRGTDIARVQSYDPMDSENLFVKQESKEETSIMMDEESNGYTILHHATLDHPAYVEVISNANLFVPQKDIGGGANAGAVVGTTWTSYSIKPDAPGKIRINIVDSAGNIQHSWKEGFLGFQNPPDIPSNVQLWAFCGDVAKHVKHGPKTAQNAVDVYGEDTCKRVCALLEWIDVNFQGQGCFKPRDIYAFWQVAVWGVLDSPKYRGCTYQYGNGLTDLNGHSTADHMMQMLSEGLAWANENKDSIQLGSCLYWDGGDGSQPLTTWQYEYNPNGYARIQKVRAQGSTMCDINYLLGGEAIYSRAGAQFRITDMAGKDYGVLTTGNDGLTGISQPLPAGTYKVREIKVPKNYTFNGPPDGIGNEKIVTITAANTQNNPAQVTFSNPILGDPIDLALFKHQNGTRGNSLDDAWIGPQGDSTWADVRFRLYYFNTEESLTYQQAQARVDSGNYVEAWDWKMKDLALTSNFHIGLSGFEKSNYLGNVKGLTDPAFVSNVGKANFPVGCYMLVETKAPKGFVLSDIRLTFRIVQVSDNQEQITHNTVWISSTFDGNFQSGDNISSAVIPPQTADENSRVIMLSEPDDRYALQVQKGDVDSRIKIAQGDANWEGIQFAIYNRSVNPIVIDGQTFNPGSQVTNVSMVTDANGYARTTAVFPQGTYGIREVSRPSDKSYLLTEGREFTFTLHDSDDGAVMKDGQVFWCDEYKASNGSIASLALNDVIDAGLRMDKQDYMFGNPDPHGDTDLSGAQFAIINASDAYMLVNSNNSDRHESCKSKLASQVGVTPVAKSMDNIEAGFGNAGSLYQALKKLVDAKDSSVVMTKTTDKNGSFEIPNIYLPFGTYYIIETKTPTGYLLNNQWVGKVVVRDSNKRTVIPVTSVYNCAMDATKGQHEQPEQIYRGGVSAVKFDALRDDTRDHGDAKLSSAQFTIINASVSKAQNKDGVNVPTCGLTDETVSYAKLAAAASKCTMQVITTGSDGIAKTGTHDLPYGTYYIFESKIPEGYFMNDTWVGKVVIREDGEMYNVGTTKGADHDTYNHTYYEQIGHTPVISPGDAFAVRDSIFRSGVNIQKVDKEMGKQTAQGESVLYGAEFTILNASDASARNRDRLDIDTCKGQISAHPTYAELRKVADAGNCTMEVLTTNSEGFTTGKRTDLPYGTYYVIETKASYGYHIDTTFVGKITVRDDNLMLALGESKGRSSFIDINDTNIQVVEEQERRCDLYMLKVNIDGEYKPYIPFLISAVRVEPDGSETVLESHVMVTDEYGRLDTSRPRDPKTVNGMDQYVKEKTITAEGEKHLREAANWGVWFQGNSDDAPKNGMDNTAGALYTCHYRVTELHCNDNKDLEENLVASNLIYVYNDTCEQHEVMKDANDKVVVHHPLVDTEIEIESKATDVESETQIVPVRDSVEIQDWTRFIHVSADHKYRMETQFVDLTDGRKPIKILGTTDEQAELSEDSLWVTKEFYPKKQSGTNNTWDTQTMYAAINTKAIAGHKIMAVDYLYQYIDVTGKDDVKGDWILVARHPHDSEIIEDQCLYVPDLHTHAKDGETGTRIGVKSETSSVYDTVEFHNLSKNEQYVIRMTLKDTKTGEYAVVDGKGNPIYVQSDPIFRRGSTPVSGKVTMPKLTFDSSKFTDQSLTVIEELFRTDEEGNPMGEPLVVHDSMLDEDQTIRYVDMDSHGWDIRTNDDVGAVEDVATIVDKVTLHNVVFENTGKGQYTYQVDGHLVHQKAYKDANGKVFQAGDTADLLDGSKTSVILSADADGVCEVKYADGTIANGSVSILGYGNGLAHVVYPERVGDNSYVTDYSKAYADVTVELIYKVNSSILEEATLVSYADLHHDAVLCGFEDAKAKSLLAKAAELFTGKSDEKPVLVSTHNELLDEDQTVHYPRVQTLALDNSTKDDVGAIRDDAVITDTVTLRNLIPGHEYIVKGKLYNQHTGKPYLSNGGEVTQQAHIIVTNDGKITAPNGEKTVTLTYDEEHREVSGTVDLIFRFNALGLEDQTLVVFEDLIHNGVKVATHADIEDKGQSIHFPKIRTTNNDGYTKDHVATVHEEAVIVDTVKYSNLVPGKTYTMKGELMCKDSGERLLDKEGNPVHASRTFVAGEEEEGLVVTELDEKLNRVSGTVDITFKFDATLLEGKTAVAFETLEHNKITVTTHTDLQDEEQTVHFPKVRTSAIDIQTRDEVGTVGQTTITDTVRLWNLIPGQTYTVKGVLMDRDTEKPLLVDGKEVRQEAVVRITKDGSVDTEVSKECTCGNPKYCACGNGSVRITSWNSPMRSVDVFVNLAFELDASSLEGKTTVVFEDLVHNDVVVAHHTDIKDLSQTIHFPKIRTTATDMDTNDHAGTVTDTARIEDVVKYENLVVGRTYTLKGTLMDQVTGAPILGRDGKPVTSQATFVASEESSGNNQVLAYNKYRKVVSGEYTLVFELDSSVLAGHTAVVFEELYHNDVKVTTHTDIDDSKQSVHYPDIHTMARDESTGDHVGTLWGSMINSIRQLFGEKDADGNGIPDHKQQNIIDTVSLNNLVPGYTYVVSGMLMDVDESHEAGEPIPLLIDGETITQAVTITVSEDGKSIKAWDGSKTTVTRTDLERESVDGTVELVYTLDSSKISGKKTVVFEDLYHDSTYDRDTVPTEVKPEDLVHKHRDIDDENQSVSEVKVHTTAVDTATESHVGAVPDDTNDNLAVIRDEVLTQKLVPGMEYRIEGALVDLTSSDLEHGKVMYLTPNGGTSENREEAIRQTLTFTAESETETHELYFGISGDYVQGKSVTVFEDLYHNDIKIAVHPMLDAHGKIHPEDFAEQTVYYPTGKTNATDNTTGNHTSYAGETRKVTDRVYFENLLVGEVYEIRGQLMYQTDFMDADGNVHTAGSPLEGAEVGVRFKAATDLTKVMLTNGEDDALIDSLKVTKLPNGKKVISGYVSLVFTVDASKLAGATLVAFESFYQNDVPLFVHDDLDDFPQTVRIPKIHTNAKAGDLDEASVYDENGEYRDITITDTVSYQNLWTQAQLDQMKEDGKYVKYQDGTVRDTDSDIIYDINEKAIYILKGVLMDKETGESVLDKDGNTYTVFSDPFSPEAPDGTLDVVFTINGRDLVKDGVDTLEGKTLVVFEDLYQAEHSDDCGEGTLVGTHHDIEDDEQDIRFPKVRTHAVDGTIEDGAESIHEKDAASSVHESLAGDEIVITDRVTFENLHGASSYEVSGVLQRITEYDENGKPVKWEPVADADGNPVTSSAVIDTTDYSEDYNDSVSGMIDLEFRLDGTQFGGETFVVFESLTYNGILVGIHADIEDESQTIYVPKIGTKLGELLTGLQEILADKDTVLVDTVAYENLEAGKTYALHARLMNDRDGSEVAGTEVIGFFTAGVDDQVIFADGTQVLSQEELVQMAKDGKITVQPAEDDEEPEIPENPDGNITIDDETEGVEDEVSDSSSDMAPDDIEDTDVSEDEITDSDVSEDTDTKEPEMTDEEFAAKRRQETAIYIGRLFEELASKQDTKPEEPAEGEVTVDPSEDGEDKADVTEESSGDVTEEPSGDVVETPSGDAESVRRDHAGRVSGTVKVAFPINGKKLAGNTVVAFETLYAESEGAAKVVAIHEDLTDKDQSVTIPFMRTSARIDGEKSSVASERMVVTDTITYKNLVVGQKYTMHGVLMDKATGESTEITAEADFTPELRDGFIELNFVFDGTNLAGHELVVFETLTTEGPDGEDVIVGEHKDIEDQAQTVMVLQPNSEIPVESIDTGERQMLAVVLAAGLLGLLLGAAYVAKKRKIFG